MVKTYSELSKLKTFDERFRYLKLNGQVGSDTFGFDRYLNQKFYNSQMWRRVRDQIIVRDNGCDLGIDSEPIHGIVIVHHINPLMLEDITELTEYVLNPEYLICVSDKTHKALHYGNEDFLKSRLPIERKPNDTCPWK